MHLFPFNLPETIIEIKNSDLRLRHPLLSDFNAWCEIREKSRDFLTQWEPLWPRDDLTRAGFRRRLRNYKYQRRTGRGDTFFLVTREKNQPVGGISISNIRRGVSNSCGIGYWMGNEFANQGYMSCALEGLKPYIFNKLELLRIEAACLPNNTPSIRLLERCGFQREGTLRKYLNINGRRRDHILYSFLIDDIALDE